VLKLRQQFESLAFDDPAAEEYGSLRRGLAAQGLMMGPNDLMIAATAMANRLMGDRQADRRLPRSRRRPPRRFSQDLRAGFRSAQCGCGLDGGYRNSCDSYTCEGRNSSMNGEHPNLKHG
jgi:hypothetical protein